MVETKDREEAGAPHNFLRAIVAQDVAAGKHGGAVVTRFPPEPNGYPHIGHVKAMSISYGIAKEFRGRFHLRFDDTNPESESLEYVEAIQRDVRWLGFEWGTHLYFASDYFERLYGFAQELIRSGKAYVCSQDEESMRASRGSITEPGTPSPFRSRSVEENLDLFARMRAGEFPDGAHVLRAKIDMANPNMKMRDPAIYRIRHHPHYRLGRAWCIYPLYDFQHCLSDAIEGITHSLCSLEFENNRELYDWYVANVSAPHVPHQYEFARLNVTYTVTSKRVLRELVEKKLVSGWDDPRMPTVSGMRRRGYTPEALRDFCERLGVARNQSTAEFELLEHCVREDLNRRAPRFLCVLRPLRLVIENYPEGQQEVFSAPHFPSDVGGSGERDLTFSRTLYIEQEDFADPAPKQWHRLSPGMEVRLRHAYVIRCTGVERDATGAVTVVRAVYDPESRSNSARAVRGTIHWVSERTAVRCEVRLYERLFAHPTPVEQAQERGLESVLNEQSLEVVHGYIEASSHALASGQRVQFERHGFFCVDDDSRSGALVFNRTVQLKDSWAKLARRDQPAGVTPAALPPAALPPPARPAHERAVVTKPEALPKTPLSAQAAQLAAEYSLPEEHARLLAADPALASFYRDAVQAHAAPRTVANFMTTELLRVLKDRPLTDLPFGGADLGQLVGLVDSGEVSLAAAKTVFGSMLAGKGAPAAIIAAEGLGRVSDRAQMEGWADAAIRERPDFVKKYRQGQAGLLGALVGHVMRLSGGRADPALVSELLKERLAQEP